MWIKIKVTPAKDETKQVTTPGTVPVEKIVGVILKGEDGGWYNLYHKNFLSGESQHVEFATTDSKPLTLTEHLAGLRTLVG